MTPTLARPHCEADAAEPRRVRLGGDWTLSSALEVAEQLRTLPDAVDQLDATGIDRIDSAGVLQLMRFAKRRGMELSDIAFRTDHQALVSTIEDVADDRPPRKRDYGVLAALSRLGQRVHENGQEIVALLSFTGENLVKLVRMVKEPRRFRPTATVAHMEAVGLDAVPLVILLSYMVGAVIAFLGSRCCATSARRSTWWSWSASRSCASSPC